MKRLPQNEKLFALAEELGVSTMPTTKYERNEATGKIAEPVLQARVLSALAERRNHRLWVLALTSAVASVFSALAAWFAVILHAAK
jgi:hypothetical protein